MRKYEIDFQLCIAYPSWEDTSLAKTVIPYIRIEPAHIHIHKADILRLRLRPQLWHRQVRR